MAIYKQVLKSLFCLIILLLLIFSCGCGNNEVTKLAATVSPTISVQAEKIVDDYIRDITTAEKKYKNKNVSVTGKVLSKGQYRNSQRFIVTVAKKRLGGKLYSVSLGYPTSRVNEVNNLKIGDFVAVEGLCFGMAPQDDPTIIDIQIEVDAKASDNQPTNKTSKPSTVSTPTTASIPPASNKGTPAEGLYQCNLGAAAGNSIDILDVPSFERGDKVGTLVQGEKFFEHTYVTNYKGELWCRILLDSSKKYAEGYVPASMIAKKQGPNTDESIPVRWRNGNGIINFDDTKLRSEPNSDSTILAVMKTDDQCSVLARVLIGDNTWYKVSKNGNIGYVSGTFIDVKPDAWGNLPVEKQ